MDQFKKTTKILVLAGLVLSFVFANVAFALGGITDQSQAGMAGLLNQTGSSAGWDTTNIDTTTGLSSMLGTIARFVLSFIGVIFMLYVIYGGFLWLTASGNEEKVDQAKKIIRDGVIGLVVTLSVAGIYILVMTALGGTISTTT